MTKTLTRPGKIGRLAPMIRTGTLAATLLAGALTLHGGSTGTDPSAPDRPLRTAAPAGVGSCAGYGQEYHKVDGSDTCIRIGGSVRFEAGVNVGGSGRR